MENKFKAIDPTELGNAIEMIGNDWTIISALDEDKESGASGMTASWGALGVLWKKPVCICFIRPQRHTFELAEKQGRMAFNFFASGEKRDTLAYFGKASGRDTDKFKDMDLTALFCELDGERVPYIAEAETVIFGKKLYADDIKKASFLDPALLSNYPADDFHRVYVCEIERVIKKVK